MKKKIVTGVYDTNTYPLTVGGMLLFMGDLLCQKEELRADRIHLIVIVQKNTIPDFVESLGKGITGIDTLSIVSNAPESDDITPDFDSTLKIQTFFAKHKFIPYLSCKQVHQAWATQFLETTVKHPFTVIVHLKNNVDKSLDNAQMNEWLTFFKNFSQTRITFVLIGNEPIPAQICQLPNVILSRDYEGNLIRDLALIEKGNLFMGVASGSANMAILSSTPYLIYKHPQQHAEAMQKELSEKDHFTFATPFQKFFRTTQKSNRLIEDFHSVYSSLVTYEQPKIYQ